MSIISGTLPDTRTHLHTRNYMYMFSQFFCSLSVSVSRPFLLFSLNTPFSLCVSPCLSAIYFLSQPVSPTVCISSLPLTFLVFFLNLSPPVYLSSLYLFLSTCLSAIYFVLTLPTSLALSLLSLSLSLPLALSLSLSSPCLRFFCSHSVSLPISLSH